MRMPGMLLWWLVGLLLMVVLLVLIVKLSIESLLEPLAPD